MFQNMIHTSIMNIAQYEARSVLGGKVSAWQGTHSQKYSLSWLYVVNVLGH